MHRHSVQNAAGQTFLHVLVPDRLDVKLLDILLSCKRTGFDVMQCSNFGVYGHTCHFGGYFKLFSRLEPTINFTQIGC